MSYFTLSLCFPAIACAQSIGIAPAAADRGSANIIRMVLTTNPEKPIAALQWELSYPESLNIQPAGVVPGTASEAAGKTITCAAGPAKNAIRRISCILAGGTQVIPAGVIAIVRFEVPANASPGKLTIEMQHALGASSSLGSIGIENTSAPITVR